MNDRAPLPSTARPASARLVFLIGYRGAGKSSVAELLAPRLGWDWIDADRALEQRAGQTIAQIFASDGEAAFRRLESQLLAEWCTRKDLVIATGGGIILAEQNRLLMQSSGEVVWLTADVKTLTDRLQQDSANAERRPRLTVGGRAEIEELLRLREPLYRACANWTVDTAGCTLEAIVDKILLFLGRSQ